MCDKEVAGHSGNDYTPAPKNLSCAVNKRTPSAVVNISTTNWVSKRSFGSVRKPQLEQHPSTCCHRRSFWVANEFKEMGLRNGCYVSAALVKSARQGRGMRGPRKPLHFCEVCTHIHMQASCSLCSKSLERFGSQHAHAPAE